jgi:hypothetical protein
VVRFRGTSTGIGGSLLALSNTAPGGPVAAASADSSEVRLSLESTGCLVVASHAVNDAGGTGAVRARGPLETLFSRPTGSSMGGSGHHLAESAEEVAMAFSGGKDRPATAAAAFAPRR